MQANWSLILNVLLLIGVIAAIGRLMRVRKQGLHFDRYKPAMGKVENSPYDAQPYHDDIIAVRKVNKEISLGSEFETEADEMAVIMPKTKDQSPKLMPQEEFNTVQKSDLKWDSHMNKAPEVKPAQSKKPISTLMLFLLSKENRQFAGYELLQTVLSSGLRFGEGHLFHKYRQLNGQNTVLCSVAAATATGEFDLQNIGAFSVRGLCLYMQVSNQPQIDAERFYALLDVANQLRDGLDAYLLDDQRKPLTKERLEQYQEQLNIHSDELEHAIA